MPRLTLCWLRRDLRLEDHAALYHALRSGQPVLPVFIFDRDILDALEDRRDRRVEFIYGEICRLRDELRKHGSALIVRYGRPIEVWRELLGSYDVAEVHAARDYEVYAKARDAAVGKLLADHGAKLHLHKDQVIFEGDEIRTGSGTPYTVYSPYRKKWLGTLTDFYLEAYPTERYLDRLHQTDPLPVPTLAEMRFEPVGLPFPDRAIDPAVLRTYDRTRDTPALERGTSRLGIHLRFGTISVRTLARAAQQYNETYLSELIWRDFYSQVLDHFPHVGEGRAFREAYDRIEWRNDEAEFRAWCEGRTGYPLVDAGMRQLNATGFMHNRVRMVTSSFLIKHLLIDWRWGEAYFAANLLDYDLSNNNGGWQWAAGSGTDAAPYFRVFNPASQQKKFDPKGAYVRQWVPEWEQADYPAPIVAHEAARERVLAAYRAALEPGSRKAPVYAEKGEGGE
jgi:deoxyribodipyrimidine photo-lyase